LIDSIAYDRAMCVNANLTLCIGISIYQGSQ